MHGGKIEVKRRVWVALGFALVATAGWFAWTRGTQPQPAPLATAPLKPFARLTGTGSGATDQVLRERADLFDPTPLFFPTEWNYGQRPLPERLRHQPGQAFGSFDAKRIFEDQNLKTYGVVSAPSPEKLADVLAQGNEAPFAGMGEVDGVLTPLAERSGFVEVRSFSGGEPVIDEALKNVSVPRPDFAPLEFVVAIGSAGVVGEPLLASGSGSDEVDAFFRSYLVKTFRLGQRLSPGSYRVVLGP